MFTGLVEAIGGVRRIARRGPGARLDIEAPFIDLSLGESVSVSGACLTVAAMTHGGFEADVSADSRAKTTLGALRPGVRVNLERALRLGDRMGGHVVLGHVDGVGELASIEEVGGARRLRVRAPRELGRYLAPKGSVAVDGVSLTVNSVAPDGSFELMIVPHTIGATTLAVARPADRCNLEIDVFARYVAHQLESAGVIPAEATGDALLAKLVAGGFV